MPIDRPSPDDAAVPETGDKAGGGDARDFKASDSEAAIRSRLWNKAEALDKEPRERGKQFVSDASTDMWDKMTRLDSPARAAASEQVFGSEADPASRTQVSESPRRTDSTRYASSESGIRA